MATQVLPPKSVLVPFPSASQTISQIELGLYLSLAASFKQLEEQLTAAEENFKARLLAGASVQAGDHVCRLDERSRRNVGWRAVAEDLANTLFEGQGEQYCEEVLNSTAPTTSIALVVR